MRASFATSAALPITPRTAAAHPATPHRPRSGPGFLSISRSTTATRPSGDVRRQVLDRRRLLVLMAHHLLDRRAVRERIAARQAVVQHAAQAVLIADRRQVGRVHDAFRAGAIQAAVDRVGRGHRVHQRFALGLGQQTADAEVEDAHLAVGAEHQVRRLEQAVEQALLMAQRPAPRRSAARSCAACSGVSLPFSLDDLVQRLALDQRPGQVVHAAGGADVHERHHRRDAGTARRSAPCGGRCGRSTCCGAAAP